MRGPFAFDADEDTIAFFEVECWCLQRYFDHTAESARAAANEFVQRHSDPKDPDWFDGLHHDGFFWTALRIHHAIDLGGEWSDFDEWRVNAGFTAVPEEVREYVRTHYLGNT
jgi:hypothetical protein